MKPLPMLHAQLVEQAILAAQAAGDLSEFDMPTILINSSKRADQGDYACPVAMALARGVRNSPLNIAKAIAQHIPDADFIEAVEVAPPGFINFRLNVGWLRDQLNAIVETGPEIFASDSGAGKRAQVEFLSANPTGPITVGRSRGAILGDAMARILDAAGYEVEREYYFNNAGNQMHNLGESLCVRYQQALGEDVETPDEDADWFYRGDYLIDIGKRLAQEQGDGWIEADNKAFKAYAEVVMFELIKATLDRVLIQHDVFFNENSLYEDGSVSNTLKALRDKGYIYVSPFREDASDEEKERFKDREAAHWFRSTALGDVEDRVVVKSSGEPTYTLPDIAYHMNKIERGFDLLINVLGSDHQTEARVVKYGLEALGYRTDHLHVLFMQMVRMVDKDGVVKKGSTRGGIYETLDDLITLTSADAVRYFLLNRSADSQLDFDIELAKKRSNENPVYYIQYAHVRCAGIMREAEVRGLTAEGADLSLLDDEALAFIRKELELAEMIQFAAENFAPHRIAHYALELANTFHPMYDRIRVFSEGVDDDLARARLKFYQAVQIGFKRVLDLMGMSAPEHM